MIRENMPKKEKREFVYNLAKKSIIFKPIVFKRMYRLSLKVRKTAVNDHIKKYKPGITKEEKKFLRRDLVYCKVVYDISYNEYFWYGFSTKNHFARKNFIPNIKRTDYLHLLGTQEGYKTLTDKYKSYLLLKRYYKREIILLENDSDYDKFLDYVNKYNVFVKKPLTKSFGKGIELVNCHDFKNQKEVFNKIMEDAPIILEQRIEQHADMAKLHPSSLNTIRVVTYLDPKGNITIHLPFIKVGQKGSFVDNGGAGGILATIDAKSGIITSNGKDENNNVYEVHPDTNIRFKGFKVPKWDEVIALAKQAANDFTETKYIGWDIAISKDDGPVIVEGNGRTQFIGQQIPDEVGKRKDLEKLINYRKIKKTNKDLYYGKSKYKFSVVMPLYNVEKYLEDAVNSVIKQTIGFKKNVEIIFVNDGSSDNTEKICFKYQKKYPKNIKYVKQENMGVSSARNKGLALAEGKYITFLDGDDKWKKDAFEKVWIFFEKNQKSIDAIGCRQKCFEAASNYTNLDYKFWAGSKVVDIFKYPTYIHCSVTCAFFKTQAIKGKVFDERLKYAEDSKFINEVILEKEKYGILKEAVCYYRKRNDQTSATQIKQKPLTRYLGNLNLYYKYFYDFSFQKYGKVIPFVQYLIMNAIKFRIYEKVPDEIFSNNQKEEYIQGLIDVIKKTDDEVLLNLKNCSFNLKLYLLKIKYGEKEKFNYRDGIFYLNDVDISSGKRTVFLHLDNIRIEDSKCVINGNLISNIYQNDLKLCIENKGQKIYVENFVDVSPKTFINEQFKRIWEFSIKLDLNNDVTNYKFFMECAGRKKKLLIISSPKLLSLTNGYILQNRKMILKKGNILTIKNSSIFRVVKFYLKKIGKN